MIEVTVWCAPVDADALIAHFKTRGAKFDIMGTGGQDTPRPGAGWVRMVASLNLWLDVMGLGLSGTCNTFNAPPFFARVDDTEDSDSPSCHILLWDGKVTCLYDGELDVATAFPSATLSITKGGALNVKITGWQIIAAYYACTFCHWEVR